MRWWRRPRSVGATTRRSSRAADSTAPGFPTFTIKHYNGPVTYSAEIFLERSIENMNGEFVTLPRGTVNPPPAARGDDRVGVVERQADACPVDASQGDHSPDGGDVSGRS
ncbi:Glycosyltransferase family 2 protein [Mycena kentingensis (nom. inval.)]|nr:Glycosyltransferase family 2 protein [Mycena kentingensis (nom. inval.)]